jgi:hypothetical protein
MVPVIVAVTDPTAGAATGGFTKTSFAAVFAGSSPVLLDFTDPWPLTPDPCLWAIAAIGVMRIENASKSEENALRLSGVGTRVDIFTVDFLLRLLRA